MVKIDTNQLLVLSNLKDFCSSKPIITIIYINNMFLPITTPFTHIDKSLLVVPEADLNDLPFPFTDDGLNSCDLFGSVEV